MIHSATSLKRSVCLRSLDLYRARTPGKPSRGPVVGAAFHDLAERYNLHLLATRQTTDWEGGEVIWRAALPGLSNTLSGDELVRLLRVWNRHVKAWTLNPGAALGAERAICLDRDLKAVPWSGRHDDVPPGAWIRARMDYVEVGEDGVTVTDYKTSPHVISESDLYDDLQARMYAWLAGTYLASPGSPVTVRHDYPVNGAVREVTFAPEDLPGIQEEVLTLIGRAESATERGPIPCSYCQWCEYEGTDLCGLPWSEEDARTPADLVAVQATLKRQSSGLTKRLQKAVRDAGEGLRVGDLVADWHASEGWEYDPVKALPVFMSIGDDLMRAAVKIDGRVAARLNEELRSELRMVAGKRVVATRWGVRKVKSDRVSDELADAMNEADESWQSAVDADMA